MQRHLRNERIEIPLLNGPNGMVYYARDKAEVLTDTQTQQARGREIYQQEVETKITLETKQTASITLYSETPENISSTIRRLKARKVLRMENITNKMIKELPRKGVPVITIIA